MCPWTAFETIDVISVWIFAEPHEWTSLKYGLSKSFDAAVYYDSSIGTHVFLQCIAVRETVQTFLFCAGSRIVSFKVFIFFLLYTRTTHVLPLSHNDLTVRCTLAVFI